VAQRTGVERRIRLPRKKVGPLDMLNVPLAIAIQVPIAATPIPMVCLLWRGSSKNTWEKTVIRTGESKQTRIAAMDAPAIWIHVYCAIKKKVTPVSARSNMAGRSFFSIKSL